MILCLLGTNPYDFSRLAVSLDKIAAKENKRVFIQLGSTKYKPQCCDYKDFISKSDVNKLLEEAELVICQGGFGSLSDAIMLGKKIIAVPRRIELRECVDNQVELVEFYAEKKYVVACYDTAYLEDLVGKVLNGHFTFSAYKPESSRLIKDIVSDYINKIS